MKLINTYILSIFIGLSLGATAAVGHEAVDMLYRVDQQQFSYIYIWCVEARILKARYDNNKARFKNELGLN